MDETRTENPAPVPPPGSILSNRELEAAVSTLQKNGRRVVWTNGCFDLLHLGHVRVLEACKNLGEVLVVGINDDESVRALKGKKRPINCAADRAAVVAALRSVDYVTVFSGPTPQPVIKEIHPDIFAKGGDYTLETMHQGERQVLEDMGAEIRFLPFVEGYSTTKSIADLKI